jgi:hypothetical protein
MFSMIANQLCGLGILIHYHVERQAGDFGFDLIGTMQEGSRKKY